MRQRQPPSHESAGRGAAALPGGYGSAAARPRRRRPGRTLGLSLAAAAALGGPARSAHAQKACVSCHEKVPAMIQVDGRMRSVRIDMSRFDGGPHGELDCTTCHREAAYASYPHELRQPIGAVLRRTSSVCAECHDDVAEQFASSIHATGTPRPGGHLPVCATCHDPHEPRDPSGGAFREDIPATCKTCHDSRYETYLDTYHGQATVLGRVAVAKCSDCHSGHHILPASDPASTVSRGHRLATCRRCHPTANANFAGFHVHVDPFSPRAPPVLFWINAAYWTLIAVVFTLAGAHALMYAVRGLRSGLYRRHERRGPYLRRFGLAQRLVHLVAFLSFTTAVVTGMPLRFAGTGWAAAMMRTMGGVEAAGRLHRLAAAFIALYLLVGIAWIADAVVRRPVPLTGPLSIAPSRQDVRDLFAMLAWFRGAGPRPDFGRFTYWEKFDFWALMAGTVIIGTTGLMMLFPTLLTGFAPGIFLNIALVVHANEAILAFGTVFIFMHLFHSHLRPEVFPLDPVIFTGRVPLADVEELRGREYRARFPGGPPES